MQSLLRCAEEILLEDNANASVYFNIDLEDILQNLPRGKKVAFKWRKNLCKILLS